MTDLRGVRAMLSVPAHDQRKVAKAFDLRGAKGLMIAWDLEDSVPLSYKAIAREYCAARFGRSDDAIRVNAADTPEYIRDVAVLNRDSPWRGYINLPKVTHSDHVLRARIDFPNAAGILAVIESPMAVLSVCDIAFAYSGRPDALIFGHADFQAALGFVRDSEEMVAHAQRQIGLAAAAAGIPAFDSPFCRIGTPSPAGDDSEFAAECHTASRRGFTGKVVIHPSQIYTANYVFSRPADREHAVRVVEAASRRPDGEVFVLENGDVIPPPTVRFYRKLLAGEL